ncbi:MAG: hypothetical protein KDK39_01360 [Leptospiraceae bacterium]|nr:hypothetical protein [Leptospiraceae bacterium]
MSDIPATEFERMVATEAAKLDLAYQLVELQHGHPCYNSSVLDAARMTVFIELQGLTGEFEEWNNGGLADMKFMEDKFLQQTGEQE